MLYMQPAENVLHRVPFEVSRFDFYKFKVSRIYIRWKGNNLYYKLRYL